MTLVSVQAQTPSVVSGSGPTTTGTANPISNAGQVSQIPLTISLSGPFANTRLFLTGIESMQRSMLVTGVDITRAGTTSKGTVLTTVVTSKIFIANPATAAGASPAAASTTVKTS
jgi:Tfp pilus assembly protein PilO